ncbi:MAG TPA: hypothetical protein VNB94_04005 [Mycobacteriales bacterium]|nr:hypothetical protein [Mycobacteriales bacterium]
MRVLITSAAGIGHVHPLPPLASALGAAGHDVRFCAPEDLRAGLERAGIVTVVAGLSQADA